MTDATDEPAVEARADDEQAADQAAVQVEQPDAEQPDTEAVVEDAAEGAGEEAEPEEKPVVEDLAAALEAVLLVVDEPVSEVTLAQVLEFSVEDVVRELNALAARYTEQGSGIDLRDVAGGWRFYSREDYAPWVEKFVLDGQQARLTQAALETLAVVAYRQPVSRARVSAVRGVNVDGVMRTLLARGLVEEAGMEHETGAILYSTSQYFLERLGLRSIDELPELAPYLPELDTLDLDAETVSVRDA
jgi:segregation and condensation protein B